MGNRRVQNESHWCRYCRKWIAPNAIQIAQHEEGLKHKAAVEEHIKTLSRKGPQAGAAAPAADAARTTAVPSHVSSLLEVVSRLHVPSAPVIPNEDLPQEKEEDAKNSEPPHDDGGYPAPAAHLNAEWIPVEEPVLSIQENRTEAGTHRNFENYANVLPGDPESRAQPGEPKRVIGAVDSEDDEAAAARESTYTTSVVNADAEGDIDGISVKFKKRSGGALKKRQKRQRCAR